MLVFTLYPRARIAADVKTYRNCCRVYCMRYEGK